MVMRESLEASLVFEFKLQWQRVGKKKRSEKSFVRLSTVYVLSTFVL